MSVNPFSKMHAVFAALVLTGCAAAPSKPSGAARGKIDEAAINALYARLDAGVKHYETGIGRIGDGDGDVGQREVGAALDDLRAAALQCHVVPGCEEERFLSAFDGLLRRHDVAQATDDSAEPEVPGGGVTTGEGSSPTVEALPEAARSITLLKGRQLGEIIALNGPVKAALEEWLTQYRPNLIQTYVSYQYMRYRMWPEYQKAGLPEALLFGMLAKESGGKVHAVSRSGAAGPLQFMYATGLRFGLTTVNGFDQRFDPQLATRANAAYLNEQLRIFNNNLELVMAAYNGGEGRMQRLAGPNSSFWDSHVYSALSPETRDYVPMVLAAAWLYLHPERYNLIFPKVNGKPGKIALTRPASIAELSICFGQEGGNEDGWFRALRNLNPALDPQESQPAGTKFDVPAALEAVYPKLCGGAGPWATLAAELHAAVPPSVVAASGPTTRSGSASSRNYTVRKGDTLAGIARKLRCAEPRDIADLNRLRPPHYAIRAGQTLRVPSCGKN